MMNLARLGVYFRGADQSGSAALDRFDAALDFSFPGSIERFVSLVRQRGKQEVCEARPVLRRESDCLASELLERSGHWATPVL